MHVVAVPNHTPGMCCVNLRNNDPEGFIDTTNELRAIDPHIYISISAVKEMAELIGLVSRDEVSKATERIAELTSEVERLQHELKQAEEEAEAVHILRRSYKVEAKRGPKKKEAAA